MKTTNNPNKKCFDDFCKYVKWCRMDDGRFCNINPLSGGPMVHTSKEKEKWLLLATFSNLDKEVKDIINLLNSNVKYGDQDVEYHTCYLPGDMFIYTVIPEAQATEESAIIESFQDFEKIITGKSMEYDAKAFIRVAKTHMESWEKSLERGKQGKPCNFKDVLKQIEKIRKDIIDDKDDVLGNKHVLFIDVNRYSKLIESDFYKLETDIQQYMVKQFSSGLSREEAFKKIKDKVEDYEDELESIRADKRDYRLSFLLDEFEELIDKIKDMVDPSKASKAKNIHRILSEFSSILENTGLQVDLIDDPEKRKMIMKHYTYSKELVNKFLGVTKNTAGHMYGAIVTKVMTT